jgi:NTP pyrophosphatase (non-canonical NTP hydrolase)
MVFDTIKSQAGAHAIALPLLSAQMNPRLRGGRAVDLKELQREVDRWIAPFGYWHPLANLTRLTEEVGELAREVNHRWGPKTKKPTEETGDVALEMGDILFVVAAMANQMNIDLEDAFRRVLAKYQQRDANRWKRKDQEP